MWKIILIILALLYTLNPYDILPDFFIGWGWLDDLVVLGFLGRYLYAQKKKREAFQKYYQHRQNTSGYNNGKSNRSERSHTDTNARAFSRARDPYKILEIEPGASQKDIKQAYRLLAGKYHPDKVAHLGDEFKALAEERFKDIQEAYSELRGSD